MPAAGAHAEKHLLPHAVAELERCVQCLCLSKWEWPKCQLRLCCTCYCAALGLPAAAGMRRVLWLQADGAGNTAGGAPPGRGSAGGPWASPLPSRRAGQEVPLWAGVVSLEQAAGGGSQPVSSRLTHTGFAAAAQHAALLCPAGAVAGTTAGCKPGCTTTPSPQPRPSPCGQPYWQPGARHVLAACLQQQQQQCHNCCPGKPL